MCGRFTLVTNSSTIDDHFEVDPPRDIPPQYNIAPTEPVLAVRMNTQQQREAVWLRWGFVPHWMKAEDISSKFINARADIVHQKPMFKQAFRHQRCLIPATGYFEWDQQTQQPYYFYPKNRSIMAFAGLWSYWILNSIHNSNFQ